MGWEDSNLIWDNCWCFLILFFRIPICFFKYRSGLMLLFTSYSIFPGIRGWTRGGLRHAWSGWKRQVACISWSKQACCQSSKEVSLSSFVFSHKGSHINDQWILQYMGLAAIVLLTYPVSVLHLSLSHCSTIYQIQGEELWKQWCHIRVDFKFGLHPSASKLFLLFNYLLVLPSC